MDVYDARRHRVRHIEGTHGRCTVALHVQGKMYRFPLVKAADPETTATQREFEAAFAQQRKYCDLVSRIDVVLNEMHRMHDALAADKSGDMKPAIASIDAMTAALTSNPKNFEDSIQSRASCARTRSA